MVAEGVDVRTHGVKLFFGRHSILGLEFSCTKRGLDSFTKKKKKELELCPLNSFHIHNL